MALKLKLSHCWVVQNVVSTLLCRGGSANAYISKQNWKKKKKNSNDENLSWYRFHLSLMAKMIRVVPRWWSSWHHHGRGARFRTGIFGGDLDRRVRIRVGIIQIMVVDMFELYNIVSWETKRMITMAKESWAADDILWSRFNLGMMIAEEEFEDWNDGKIHFCFHFCCSQLRVIH